MTSAAVNPTMRSHGWNIELLTAPGDVPFAGVFQPAKDVFMTFRDIVNEMRLSFEFKHESPDVWNEVAFGLLDMLNVAEGECHAPKFVQGNELDQPVPALLELEPDALEDRVILQYRVFKHNNCGLSPDQPPKCHFKAGCAQRISKPDRRLEPRYLPPKKASNDPRYATYPLRKTARGRKPASPSKRLASGSVSPRKDLDMDQADEDFANMVAPPECNISDERAKITMANFRSSCLTLAKQCAVTGMGRSWCDSPTIGPALQACHIVSQLQYHTYPDPEADPDETQDGSERASLRRLEQAWERTWASENGILLFSHLHDMFDQRLFSIYLETLWVRAFMPYDILLAHHGRKAKVQRRVDRAALRHHYDMCCIENMAAKMPFVEQLPRTETSISTSGINTPLEIRPTLVSIASPRMLASPSQQDQGQDGQGLDGDPSKRARQSKTQHNPELMSDCIDSSGSLSNKPMDNSSTSPDLSWSRKRKREHELWIAANHDSCLTPCNSEEFLADVSWELTKIARRRKWETTGT